MIQGAKYPIQKNLHKVPCQTAIAEPLKPPIVTAEEKVKDAAEEIAEAMRSLVGDKYSIVYIRDKLNRDFGRNYTKDDIVKMRSEL